MPLPSAAIPLWRGPPRWRPRAWIRNDLRVRVEELPGTGNVSVRLDYRSPVRVVPFGVVLDDLVLSGEAVMRSER